MTDTPDLHTLAAEALDHVMDRWLGEPGGSVDRLTDAVLAPVLPAHRRQVLDQAADAITTLLDRYHQDLTLDTPADTAAYRAGRQAVTDAAALVRRLASAAPETAPSPRQDDETAPAVPHDTNGWPYG